MREKKLETHNSLAKSFFNQTDVFMVAISSDEVVVDINKKACEILGYSSNEVKGKNWFENFVPTAKKTEAKRLFHNALFGISINY
jgi:two-component system NtrC family sensor kinase